MVEVRRPDAERIESESPARRLAEARDHEAERARQLVAQGFYAQSKADDAARNQANALAAASAAHISASMAFILSLRIRRTSAMPSSSMLMEMRFSMALFLVLGPIGIAQQPFI